MAKVVTVRTLGGVEHNTIYEPIGVLLPEEVTKNSYFEVLVTGKNGNQRNDGTNKTAYYKGVVWGLITDEEYKTLMEVELSDTQSMEVS